MLPSQLERTRSRVLWDTVYVLFNNASLDFHHSDDIKVFL